MRYEITVSYWPRELDAFTHPNIGPQVKHEWIERTPEEVEKRLEANGIRIGGGTRYELSNLKPTSHDEHPADAGMGFDHPVYDGSKPKGRYAVTIVRTE